MTILRLAMTGFLCLGILCCCSTSKESRPSDAPDSSRSSSSGSDKGTPGTTLTPPADFACRVGSGGGITGLWSGYSMEPGGGVISWEGRIAGDDPRPAGQLDKNAINRLWVLVRDSGFMTLQSDTRGNMTYMIEITAQGVTHKAYWPAEALPAGPGTSATLTELRASLLDVLSKAGSGEK